MSARPGRHGSMPSSELEGIIARNSNFLSVIRAGSGEGRAGLYCAVSGDYILGIGGGTLPEYSRMIQPKYDCDCTKDGFCRSGAHGIGLVRGWRNILHELGERGRVKISNEIVRVLGEESVMNIVDKMFNKVPMADPAPSWNHSQLVTP